MSTTTLPFGSPLAQKKWSSELADDSRKKSYFEGRFIGRDDGAIIQRKTQLEADSGDKISFDLCVQLRGRPTYGDARVEGKEEQLRFFTDEVNIDQVRHAVSAGGRMTRKRTSHDLRGLAKTKLGDYFAKFHDEMIIIYLSGARGINQDFIEGTDFTGFAGNPLQAPDATHLMFGGAAVSKATLTAADVMSRSIVEKANVKASMMQAQDPRTSNMVPVTVDGSEAYVLLMSPFQAYSLRTDATPNGWLDIQKALATNLGNRSPIVRGGLGWLNGTVLHEHRNVIRFGDYGAGQNVKAARALFMGRQAGVIAYGTQGGLRYNWEEIEKDYRNEPAVASGFIGGIKKTRFNGMDFGVISIDTAAGDPNAV